MSEGPVGSGTRDLIPEGGQCLSERCLSGQCLSFQCLSGQCLSGQCLSCQYPSGG